LSAALRDVHGVITSPRSQARDYLNDRWAQTLEFPPMLSAFRLRTAMSAVAICVISLMLGSLLGGCGDDGNSGPSEEEQALRIEQFQSDIRVFCITGKTDLDGAADPLGTLITAVDNLIKIYREDPNATYKLARVAKTGDKLAARAIEIRKLLLQSAADLKKDCGKYAPDQARRLEEAVKA
jgi:hypothetical protein